MKVATRLTFFLALFLLLLGTARSAWAHAVHVSSDPTPNSTIDTPPDSITIQFSEPVVPAVSTITLLTQSGETIQTGELNAISEDESQLSVSTPELEQGAYLVSWRVLSAVDGHTTTGTFSFGVGVDALVTRDQVTFRDQLFITSSIASGLRLTGMALIVGALAFVLLAWRPVQARTEVDPTPTVKKVVTAGVGIMVVAAAVTFIDQLAEFGGSSLGPWLANVFGRMWLIRLLLLLLLAFVMRFIGRDTKTDTGYTLVALLVGLGLTATASQTSHSAALLRDAPRAILIDFVHIIAASLWLGGLVMLFLMLRQLKQSEPDSKASAYLILHFSTLAAFSVAILTASGSFLGWQHVGSWTALVGTAYGQLLIVKVLLMLPLLLIAAYNLFVLKKRMMKGVKIDFGRIVALEVIIGVVILGFAGFVSDTQRAADAPLLSDEAGQVTFSTIAEELTVDLQLEPALVGNNTFTVYVTDASGDPLAGVETVDLRFTFLDQAVGAADLVATAVGNGVFQGEGAFISLSGLWQVEVAIRQAGQFDVFAPYRIDAGIGGEIRPIAESVGVFEQFGRFMQLANSGAVGVFLVVFGLIWVIITQRAVTARWQALPLLLGSFATVWFGITQLQTYYANEYTPDKLRSNPVLPDSASIALGENIYNTSCIACHGETGQGDGPLALSLNPPPVNFGDGHTIIHTDGDLFYWIQNGKDGTAMPAFGEQLDEEDIWHLVNYVRRLAVLADANAEP